MESPQQQNGEATVNASAISTRIPTPHFGTNMLGDSVTHAEMYDTLGNLPVRGSKKSEVNYGVEKRQLDAMMEIALLGRNEDTVKPGETRDFSQDFAASIDNLLPEFDRRLEEERGHIENRGKILNFFSYIEEKSGQRGISFDLIDNWYMNHDFRRQVTACFINYYAHKGDIPKEIAAEAIEMLQKPNPDYLATNFVGTSSIVLDGVRSSNGKLLSFRKLREEGKPVITGEGARLGASEALKDGGVSVTRIFEVAQTYAESANSSLINTPESLGKEMTLLDKEINHLREKQRQSTSEDAFFIGKRIAELETQRTILFETNDTLPSNLIVAGDRTPIVFGLSEVPEMRQESNPELYSFRTGDEVDLKTACTQIYCDRASVSVVQTWAESTGIPAQVVPMDSLNLIRSFDIRLSKVAENMMAYKQAHAARIAEIEDVKDTDEIRAIHDELQSQP